MTVRKKLSVVEVAQRLGIKYLKARDMMLAKKFGESMLEGKNLKVYADNVELYLTSNGARRVGDKKKETANG